MTAPARQVQPDTVHADALAVMIASAAPRCRSLAALLRRVPGAYPGDVLATVDRLAANWLLDPATSRRLRTPASPGEENQEGRTLLPDPHPLDYDWRWDPRTVQMLLARCIRATRPGDTIALLGTPTLLAAAAGHHERHWLLLEASEATAAALASTEPARVVRCDLAVDELPLLHAQAVVADPPWYTADTRVFMWAAARLSVPGAVVLPFLPDGERGEQDAGLVVVEDGGAGGVAQGAVLRLGEDVQPRRDGPGSLGMRRSVSGPPRSGLSWAQAMAAAMRGSCQLRARASWSADSGARAVASAVSTVSASARPSWPPRSPASRCATTALPASWQHRS